MQAKIYPIAECDDGLISILARPRGGEWLEEEVSSWRKQRIDLVVSLLEESEIRELGLEQEQEICTRAGIEFLSYPIKDRGVPSSESGTRELAQQLLFKLFEGKSIGVHCRMGGGRSSLLVACVLIAPGANCETIWHTIEEARGCPIPDTEQQREWVSEYAKRIT